MAQPVPVGASTRPSTCFIPGMSIVPSGFTVAAWQSWHVEADGYPACEPGGSAWQDPQVFWVPSTCVQTGAVATPRLLARNIAPWQYTPLHVEVAGSNAAAGAFCDLTDAPAPAGASSIWRVPSRCAAASSGWQ